MIPLLLLFIFCLMGTASSQNICKSPPDLGTVCTNGTAPSIRFYFDKNLRECLPFKYFGCGGNENNFANEDLCGDRCIPEDDFSCPANTPPLNNTFGDSGCGRIESREDVQCADVTKSFCEMGPFGFGMCCSLDAQKRVNQDHGLTCSNGKKKYTVNRWHGDIVFIGKSCDLQFCPDGYDCQKGNFYAFCCPK